MPRVRIYRIVVSWSDDKYHWTRHKTRSFSFPGVSKEAVKKKWKERYTATILRILKLQADYHKWVEEYLLELEEADQLTDEDQASNCGRWWADKNGYLFRPLLSFEKELETGAVSFSKPEYRIISKEEVWDAK